MDFKDYYKILGVERNASADAIKTAYRKLARKYHPDLNPGDKKAEERFKGINEAYDELGSNWEQIIRDRESARQHARPGFGDFGGAAAGGEEFSDFFREFFGGGPFGRGGVGPEPGRPQAGEDTEHGFPLTLEELVAGGKRSVRLSGGELCGAGGGGGRGGSAAGARG